MPVKKWQNYFTVLFLLLLASFSLFHLFVGCFHLIVPEIGYLYLALLCIFLWISACLRHGILFGMPFSALLLFYIYRTYSTDLSQELFDFLDRISETYYYHFYLSDSIQVFSNSVDSHLVIVLFLMFVIAALIASSLTAVTWRIPLCLLSTIPLFAFCIAVDGNPAPVSSLSLVLFWLLLFLTGGFFQKEGKTGRILLFGFPPSLFLILFLFTLFNPSRYQYSEENRTVSLYLSQIETRIADWITNRDSSFAFSPPGSVSDTDEGISDPVTKPLRTGWGIIGQPLDMTRPYDSSVSDETVFEIRSDCNRMLYLRGNSYGEYTGTSWQIAGEYSPSSLSFGATVLSQLPYSDIHSFEIDSEYAYSCLFLPYYSLSSSRSDSFVASNGSSFYRGSFYIPVVSFSSILTEEPVIGEEAIYRDYAHSYFTQLPSATRSAVQQICEENGLYPGNQNIIDQVAFFVRNSGHYNLDTDPYPDSDYAVYFLENAQEGYCIHFATAATVLYRSLGIPARLTEGFLVSCKDSTAVQVTGANAHAWVEIYLDGFGWIRIVVTASSEYDADLQNPDLSTLSDSILDTDISAISPDHSFNDESSPSDEIEPADSSPDEYEPNSVSSSTEMPQSMSQKVLSNLLLFFLLLFSLFLLVFLQYYFRLFLRKAIYRRSDNSKKAVFLWICSDRIRRFGIPIPQVIQTCAEKARFSRHGITDAEIGEAELWYAEQLDTAYKTVPMPQIILLKYIYGIGGTIP